MALVDDGVARVRQREKNNNNKLIRRKLTYETEKQHEQLCVIEVG